VAGGHVIEVLFSELAYVMLNTGNKRGPWFCAFFLFLLIHQINANFGYLISPLKGVFCLYEFN